MNGNYYINKLLIKIKKEKNFIWFITIIVFLINFDISIRFFLTQYGKPFNITSLSLDSGDSFMTGMFADKYLLIWMGIYYLAAFLSCRGYGRYVFEFFIKKAEFKPKTIEEKDIIAPPFPYNQDKLQLIVGLKHKESTLDLIESPKWIVVPEKGLFQDFLISGGKGTGKTQSCMYPFTKQMLYYKAYSPNEKAGMLILDVKGNYTKTALEIASDVNRDSDVIIINLSGKYRYNPLHKPSLRPQVIANRLRTVLELFSTQHADSYWLDKAEVLLTQAIKLVRLFNKEYVTFVEIHKVVNIDDYLNEKIEYLQELEDRNKLSRDQKANFRTVKDYFLNEYRTLDTKISSVIKSEVTRMTQTFIDDPDILKTFCAPKDKLNFFGFDDLVDTGKVVVLDMNIAEFRNLSKIIAAYLKLDFQSAAMIRLTRKGANVDRPLVFISDEYQEYVTANDADFYSVSREAKCINIVATQSYSSLLKTIKNQEALHTILTNLTNKIWLRTDDKKTAEVAVSQCGTVKKREVSYNIGKGGTKKEYSHLLGESLSKGGTTYNESYNMNVKSSNKFEIETFTIELKTFKAVVYVSDGMSIAPPTIAHLEPYFGDNYQQLSRKVKPALKNTRNSIKSASLRAEDDYDETDNLDEESQSEETNSYKFEDTSQQKEENVFEFDGFEDPGFSNEEDDELTGDNSNQSDGFGFDGLDDNSSSDFGDIKLDDSDTLDDDISIKDTVDFSNYDFKNNVEKTPDKEETNSEIVWDDEEESFDDEEDYIEQEDDDFDLGDYSSKSKKQNNSNDSGSSGSSEAFIPKYIDKKTEKELEDIEGVFDEE